MIIKTFDTKNGLYAFQDSNLTTDFHAHPALECVLATSGHFSLMTPEKQWDGLRLALIMPNYIHAFRGEQCTFEFLFIETGYIDVGMLSKTLGSVDGNHGILVPGEPHYDIISAKGLQPWYDPNYAEQHFDQRISICMRHIREYIMETHIPLSRLAAAVHLSPGRLSHLFRAQVGLSIRKYIVWVRMKTAIDVVIRGQTDLTQAAYAAGFYDAAHFSRCFRELFGIKPSAVYNNSRIVQAGAQDAAQFCPDKSADHEPLQHLSDH